MDDLTHANSEALLDVLVIYKRSDCHHVESLSVLIVALGMVFFEMLEYPESWFVSVHNRHVEVHEDELVETIAAFLFHVLQEFVGCLKSIESFVHWKLIVFFQHELQWYQVEEVVIYDQYFRLAKTLYLLHCDLIQLRVSVLLKTPLNLVFRDLSEIGKQHKTAWRLWHWLPLFIVWWRLKHA